MFDHFSDIPQRLNFAVLQNLYRFEFDYENVTFAESLCHCQRPAETVDLRLMQKQKFVHSRVGDRRTLQNIGFLLVKFKTCLKIELLQ